MADGLDAVVPTHRHADHALDLHGLFRARRFGRRDTDPLPLYALHDVLDQVIALGRCRRRHPGLRLAPAYTMEASDHDWQAGVPPAAGPPSP